ncbi:MAG TPA: hypothetical protein PKV73_12830 [Agriterribacter sp.]|nr:hypothetical protein [Agriterribacter sp.]
MWKAVKKPHNGTKRVQSEADKKTYSKLACRQAVYSNLLFKLTPDLQSQRFLATDLGKLHQSIPFKELALLIPQPAGKLSGKGCKSWLTVEGGIALLIAKHYLQLSDAMLVERLNTDWALQMFCGIADFVPTIFLTGYASTLTTIVYA